MQEWTMPQMQMPYMEQFPVAMAMYLGSEIAICTKTLMKPTKQAQFSLN